ncbi:FkbM family methyltransferase [Pedobacter sp. UYP30]|uniref:FkbM family methyltransferase n=1 Tax=Pedobacter sp. UYP30 TaxID=1756400 RepID=UPI0033949B88
MITKIKNRFHRLVIKNKKDIPGKLSYSQCGEDVIVEFIFNQLGIFKPSYLDIGAHDPFYLSNTALFYQKGCRGINIEPDPYLFQQFPLHRKEDINLNIGIGDTYETIDFYIMNVPTLNTFSLEQVNSYKNEGEYFVREIKKVKISTIQKIIIDNNGLFPDFLSLDAEGIDELVIKSIDYSNKPKVICVETLSFSSSGKGIKNEELIKFVEENDYLLYADTYINSIFVSKDIWETQGI